MRKETTDKTFGTGTMIDPRLEIYPRFRDEFHVLVVHGIITPTDKYYRWNESKTSLAQYFRWYCHRLGIDGGFWEPIEENFLIKNKAGNYIGVKRHSLRLLADRDTSKGLKKIEAILEAEKKERLERESQDYRLFGEIASVIEKARRGASQEKIAAIEKIKMLLN